MPAISDHVRRDAEYTARAHVRIEVSPIIRRLDEAAKAYIADRLAKLNPGEDVDGKALGREAVESVIHHYLVADQEELAGAQAAVAAAEDADSV